MYGRAIAGPITGAICFFGLVLKNLGLDLKFPLGNHFGLLCASVMVSLPNLACESVSA
jgi:hypothetical protein